MADAWYGTWQSDRWDSRHWSQSNWDAAGAWGAADGQATAAQAWPDGQQDDQPAAQAWPQWDAVDIQKNLGAMIRQARGDMQKNSLVGEDLAAVAVFSCIINYIGRGRGGGRAGSIDDCGRGEGLRI